MDVVIFIVFLILLFSLVYPIIKIKKVSSQKFKQFNSTKTPQIEKLYQHVHNLSVKIGSRSVFELDKIKETEDYITVVLKSLGLNYNLQTFEYSGNSYSNIIVTFKGTREPGKVFIIGAHYDTVYSTPGADDNASGVATLLEMCRLIKKNHQPLRTLELIFFTLEEPPAFKTRSMGSYVYAKYAKDIKKEIFGMISLEMIGYYSKIKGGQTFPLPLMGFFYSHVPDFIAVVGNLKSRSLVGKIKNSLNRGCSIPVETLATVKCVPGVDLSDHSSFWKMGYTAVMITDTSFYRNPNYHTRSDTIETLDFDTMAELLNGLCQVVKDIV